MEEINRTFPFSLTLSLTHLLTHSFSLALSLTHSLTHSLTLTLLSLFILFLLDFLSLPTLDIELDKAKKESE